MAPHGRTPPPGSLDSSPPDSALFARLKRLAEARPDAAALRSDDKVVARATLVAEAEAVAAALVAAGVRPGGRVGVCAGRSAEAIVAMAGIVAAGAAYVPLDPAHASGQVGLMARDAGLSVCLVADAEAEWAENALPTTCARLDLAACRRGAPGPVLPAEPGGEAPACLLYTSGTTGDPKGVVIPRRAIAGLAAQSWTRLSEADRVLHVTTPAADGSLFEIWAALLAGASVAVLPPGLPTAGAVADAMRKHRVTAILWYAALHHLVIDHDIDAFETVRLNVAGGERMSSGHAARLLSRWPGIELWNSYGPTEATTGALRQRVTPEIAAAGEIPIGTPYDGFAAFLVDGSGAPLPDEPGQEGEIALSGPGVALCYHDRPRETAAAFVFDPRRGQTGTVYLTGDRGRRRADGGLDFLGRTDRQVKIGGRRVELDGVEAALAVHPDVAAAACWPVTAPGGATHLAAAIRPAAGARRAGLAERARAAAARLVGAAVLPRRLSVVEAMPLTPAGKIDRRALAEALAGPGRAEAAEGVRATLAAVWDDLLGCGTPHDEASFFELGGNSLVLIEAHLRIEAALGVRVPMSDLLSAPRFSAQVDRLEALLARPVRGERRAAAPRPAGPEGSRDIAIIGMAARLPGLKAEGPAALDHFWEALRAGRSLIRRSVPDDGGAEGDGEGGGEGGRGPRARIEGAELFDCAHFDILPREADLMDPQARIFLELCRHALDDAGIAGERGPTAVFAGAAPSRYLEAIADGRADGPERGDEAARLGNAMDAVATRVAHRLGLTGPAMSVGAACSASLVAVAQAVACLRAGQADVALAGGAFLSFPRDGASDPDGEAERTCRPFDAEAAGTVSGDGAGVVALRRLDDALRDGDPIRAVIRGAGLNNDGADRASFSAPSVAGQAGAIRMALADAGIAPGSIGHVEAHGMATPLGDAVEVAALAQAFEGTSGEEAPVVLGTVKGTIGHADVASGVLGLIKTVLVLERGEIPPIAGLRTPSPDLPLAGTPIRLALAPVRWEEGARPRRAGVSSFGVGGTNAHLVLEEAPPDERAVPEGPQILPLSARSPEALAEAAHALAERLDRRDAPPLARVAATLQHGRAEEPFRLAVAARAAGQAADRLRAAPRPDAPVSGTPPEIVFVFPGPAAAYPGMGAGLYRAEPVYRATIDAGAEALAALTGTDIRRVLFARDMAQSEAAEALRRADIAGPALYLTEVALGRLWEARGVGPAAVVGCSVGGISAATLAGVMSLEDGLRLLAPGAGGGSAALAFEAPRIPLLSAATGRSMSDEEARDPAQWAGGAPDSKNFAGALRAACEGAFRMLVVAGPCAASSALAEGTLGRGGHGEVTQSLPDHTQPQSDLDVMASACACLWQAGVSLDWSLCGTGGAVRRVSLPGTVFRRRRHWIDPPARVAEEHRGRRSSASPASPAALEVELARLVSKLSGREIGPDRAEATFVALGFDSLFLGRVSAALSAEYGVRIGLRLLLSEAPTIRALARCLAREIAAQDTAQAGGQAGGQGAGDTAPVLLPAAGSVPSKARLATLQKRLDRHWRALGLGPGGAPARSERGGTAGSASGPPGGAALPSTEGQKEIWMAHQLGDAPACAFNETVVLTLDGPLDHDALAAALLDLVARHDALRLRFARSGESFEVLPPFAPDLPLLDLTGDAEVGLARLLDEEAAAPIDLSAGAPLRLRLVRLGATRHALVVTIHHIACDGQSRAIVLSDLGALYAARIAGRPAALPPAPSFAAHAAASGGEVPQADLAWWAAHLADPPSLPDLPTDHPRPQRRSHSGASLSVELPATVFDAARQAGAGHGCTAFGTLFAAAQIVLSRLSGARDVILGVPVSVRGRLADPALVGHCVNFIPVRVPLDPEAPAAAHLAAVGGALPEALERGDVTLGTLLRALDLPRDLSRQPLTEVRINLERDIGPLDFGPLRASARAAPRRAVNFDLVLNFVERTDGLRLDLDYNAALFTEATMRRWAGYLRRVLEGLAEDAARPVAALPLLGPEEERALVDGANATRAHYPRERSVDDLFRERSAARPEAVAVEDGTRRLSYGDLDALADAVAAALQSRLPRVGARVALSVPRDARLPACLLGILRAGHAYVPLDPGQPEARRMQVIEAACVDALLATEETGFEAGVPMIDVGAIAPGPRAAPVEVDPEAPAYIIFTSGSTGTPKGVAVPHRAMVNFLAAMIAEPGLTAADRLIAVTTVSFDISVLELFGPLLAGGVVRVASREEVLEGRPVVDEINSGRASMLQATPTLFGLLLDAGLAPPAGVRLLAGGEPVPFDLAERLMAGGAEMWNMYGPTETTVWSAARRLTPDGPITIGGPIANTELHVLDDAGRLLPPGAVGELNIGGDGLALGYFVRDDLTDAAFREVTLAGRARRLYRTGDLARRLPSGEIVVLGRRDGQVKLRGFRIELGEIESHLRAHDSVKAAAVDKRRVGGDDRLVAWLVPKADRRIDGAALARYLRARLPDYMVPQGWSVLDALPQTANGKLDRKALPTPEMGRALAAVPDAPAQAPQSVMEARLAAIWAEVLGRERIDPEATLFQIGADSLDVVRIAARQMAEGLDLETRDVLAHPSIRALAAHAEAKAPASEARRPSLAAFRDGARRPVRRAS